MRKLHAKKGPLRKLTLTRETLHGLERVAAGYYTDTNRICPYPWQPVPSVDGCPSRFGCEGESGICGTTVSGTANC